MTGKEAARWRVTPGMAVLLALPCAVAFGSLAALRVAGRFNATPADLLIPAALAVAVWERRGDLAALVRRPRPMLAVMIALAALMAWMAVSLLWALDRPATLKESAKWALALALLLAAPALLRERRDAWRLVAALALVALLEAAIGGVQGTILARDLPSSADRGVRVIGTFGQPNPYAGYLNLTLPLLAALAVWGARRAWRIAAGGAAVILAGALWLAESRGALLALVVALAAMALAGWPQARGWAVAVGGGAVAACLLIPPLAQQTLDRAANFAGWRPLTDAALSVNINDANFSSVERLAHWAAALRMLAARPLTGVGAGNYPAAYSTFAVPRWPLALGHAHNLYLNMAAELGAPGAALYLAFVAATLWLGWRAATGPPDADTRALGIGVFGALVALAVHQLFDDLATHDMLFQMMVLLALASTALTLGTEHGWTGHRGHGLDG